jgi:Domain of unknown function (DUF1918)
MEPEVTMEAQVGDEFIVDSVHVARSSGRARSSKIRIEDSREHYVVRWDDTGHETLFYPGPTSHVLHTGSREGQA